MTTPTMGDDQHQVRITSHGTRATVEVDGTDLSRDLSGYALQHHAGQAPTLVLYKAPQHDVAFEGLATVVVADQDADGETIAAWLATIDPAALSRAALARDDLDGSRHELTTAMLRQLADWAQGRT